MSGRSASLPIAVVAVLLFAGLAGALAIDGPLLGSSPNATANGTSTPAGPVTDAPADRSDTATGGSGDDAGASGGDGSDGSGGGEGSEDATADPEPASFRFTVDRVENCGTTCRDVTVSVRNQGGIAAHNVDVDVRLLADGDELWSGSRSFEAVDAGETVTRTERVKLGYFEAAKIKGNDGYVTIETTITWDDGRETFSERRKVA